jgi:hypothetical protein
MAQIGRHLDGLAPLQQRRRTDRPAAHRQQLLHRYALPLAGADAHGGVDPLAVEIDGLRAGDDLKIDAGVLGVEIGQARQQP